jgi:hypothetical protein
MGSPMPTRPQSERPLSTKERVFIEKFMQLGAGRGAGKPAALHAGFKPSYAAWAAHRMLRRPTVVREIEQRQKVRLRTLLPKAVDVVEQILDDPQHKDRLKAANQILSRVDPLFGAVAHQHDVDVRVSIQSGDALALRMLARLRELDAPRGMLERLLGHNDLPRLEALLDSGGGNGKALESEPVPIEGEVVDAEVDEDDEMSQ